MEITLILLIVQILALISSAICLFNSTKRLAQIKASKKEIEELLDKWN